jgi:hypothetical protein
VRGRRPFTDRLVAEVEFLTAIAGRLSDMIGADTHPTVRADLASARERARAVLARIFAAALERAGFRPWSPAIVALAPILPAAVHAGEGAARGSPETSRQVKCLDHAGAPYRRSRPRTLEAITV